MILSDFYQPEILQDGYKFSESGTYYAPAHKELEGYVDFINSLPRTAAPEVFGLHENADISKDLQEVSGMLDSLMSMQSSASSSTGTPVEDTIREIAADIVGRIPSNIDIQRVQRLYPQDYNESMNTVLVQEVSRFNALLAVVRIGTTNIYQSTCLSVAAARLSVTSTVDMAWPDKALLCTCWHVALMTYTGCAGQVDLSCNGVSHDDHEQPKFACRSKSHNLWCPVRAARRTSVLFGTAGICVENKKACFKIQRRQRCRRRQRCLQITGSLHNLILAVQGLALMSNELNAVGKSLLVGKVPALWLIKSFPSMKPLAAYVKEVCRCPGQTGNTCMFD